MIIIAFEDKILLGGLGDRIIGLVSCYLIAKLLKKEFYILWNKENIKGEINKKDILLNLNDGSGLGWSKEIKKILKNYKNRFLILSKVG